MDSDDKNPDAALHVRFQMISVYQPYDSMNPYLPKVVDKIIMPDETKPNPRYTGSPVYKDIPHIQITTPSGSGLALNAIVEQVRPEHKARFPKHWKMFEMSQGGGEDVPGMKLSEWPGISRSRAEELRGMKFYVVEQIAAASDQQVAGLGMDGKMLQQRAIQFLKVAKETGHAERLAAESARKDAEIAAANERMRLLEEKMNALLANQAAPQPAKRKGRPPKVQPETVGA